MRSTNFTSGFVSPGQQPPRSYSLLCRSVSCVLWKNPSSQQVTAKVWRERIQTFQRRLLNCMYCTCTLMDGWMDGWGSSWSAVDNSAILVFGKVRGVQMRTSKPDLGARDVNYMQYLLFVPPEFGEWRSLYLLQWRCRYAARPCNVNKCSFPPASVLRFCI